MSELNVNHVLADTVKRVIAEYIETTGDGPTWSEGAVAAGFGTGPQGRRRWKYGARLLRDRAAAEGIGVTCLAPRYRYRFIDSEETGLRHTGAILTSTIGQLDAVYKTLMQLEREQRLMEREPLWGGVKVTVKAAKDLAEVAMQVHPGA